MADKWTRDTDEPVTGASDERLRGVAEDDEFDDMDAGEMDDEEDDEEDDSGTF